MKACKLVTCILGFVLALMATVTAADAPPLTFKFTTVSVPGAVDTQPHGVNNAGVIVGQYRDKKQALHGYILNGKKLTKLDHPNGVDTACFGINLNGASVIVGYYFDDFTAGYVGFVYKSGKFTDIPDLAGATASYAYGINDSGEIVGAFTDSAGLMHGFLLKGKKYKTLDVPGATTITAATGINNKGSIVLYWTDSTGAYEGSLYNGKTYKTIDVPGAFRESIPSGINDEGDVTFQWYDPIATVVRGALLHDGKYFKFNDPKGVERETFPAGVNDHHAIVGSYFNHIFDAQGFTATY